MKLLVVLQQTYYMDGMWNSQLAYCVGASKGKRLNKCTWPRLQIKALECGFVTHIEEKVLHLCWWQTGKGLILSQSTQLSLYAIYNWDPKTKTTATSYHQYIPFRLEKRLAKSWGCIGRVSVGVGWWGQTRRNTSLSLFKATGHNPPTWFSYKA